MPRDGDHSYIFADLGAGFESADARNLLLEEERRKPLDKAAGSADRSPR